MKGTIEFELSDDLRPDFKPLPPAEYMVQVVNCTDKVSKQGNDMINVQMEVSAGEFIGRMIWDNLLPSGKANYRLKLFLKALGLPHKGTIQYDSDEWPGKTLKVVTYNEPYNDRINTRIDEFKPADKIEETDPVPF